MTDRNRMNNLKKVLEGTNDTNLGEDNKKKKKEKKQQNYH